MKSITLIHGHHEETVQITVATNPGTTAFETLVKAHQALTDEIALRKELDKELCS